MCHLPHRSFDSQASGWLLATTLMLLKMLLGCYLDATKNATWMLPGVTGLELKGALASGQDEGLNCDKFPSFTLPPPTSPLPSI